MTPPPVQFEHACDPAQEVVRLARRAMGTRFELVLAGGPRSELMACGEAALDEIERLDGLLSAFRGTSVVGRINAGAGGGPVEIGRDVLGLLVLAKDVWRASGGAFDPTLGGLMRARGFREENPAPDAVWGCECLELDEQAGTARLTTPGVQLDLGAIAKGWALDVAAEVLQDAGVTCAFLHGGTSSAIAMGAPPGLEGWRVAAPNPAGGGELTITLHDEAMSVSAPHGRTVSTPGETHSHVMDPRTGVSARSAAAAVCVHASAAMCDAWSTAALVGNGLRGTATPRDLRWAVARWEGGWELGPAARGMESISNSGGASAEREMSG